MKIKEIELKKNIISKKIINTICEKKFKYIALFWTIISIQFVLGNNLQQKEHIFSSTGNLVADICICIFMSIIFIALHYCILKLIDMKKQKTKSEKKINSKYSLLKYFLIIFICWIPTVLAFYPCNLGYDGGFQILNFLILNFMDHHPIIITLLYSGFFKIGLILQSPTTGMFLFSLFQMTFMAIIFALAVKFIAENTNKKWLRNVSIIFYALYPYNQLFSITTTKDVIFAGLMLTFLMKLYKTLKSKRKVTDYIVLIIIGTIMLLSRNNSVYTLIASLPFVVLVLLKEKSKCVKIAISFLTIIIMYQGANNVLHKAFSNKSIKTTSSEGGLKTYIFTQMVGRTVRDNESNLTEEEKEKISYYFKDYKEIGNKYQKNITDATAGMVNGKNINENKKEFIKYCIKLGIKYPMSYIEAFLDITRGYWYLGDTSFSEIQMYNRPGAFELYELKMPPKYPQYEVKYESKLPQLKNAYKKMFCQNYYQKIPALYVLFQPSIFFYITFAFLLYAIYKKEKNILIIAIVLFTFFASCYLSHCSIIRYMYPVMVSAPIMLGLAMKNKEMEENYNNITRKE